MAFSEQFAIDLQNCLVSPGTDMPISPASSLFLALHTSDPTANCSVGELSGFGYIRTAVVFGPQTTANSRDLENIAPVIFPPATDNSPSSVTYYSVWTDQAAGNPVSYGILDAPVNWSTGSSVAIATGLLRLELLIKPANCTI